MAPPIEPGAHAASGKGGAVPRVLWLAVPVALAGFGALEAHALKVGAPASPPERVADAAAAGRVLVFLHPRCPCSRATVAELARIWPRAGGRASLVAYVLADAALGASGPGTELWDRVAAVPGATVEADRGGLRAREHGVETSGTVLCYGPDGALRFDGGITASRGHEGANASAAALLERVLDPRLPRVSAPVFGCALGADEGTAGR